MNNVYVRLVLYALSTVAAMIPASWAGYIVYDATSQMLQISLPGLAAAIVGGLGLSSVVFRRWGVR